MIRRTLIRWLAWSLRYPVADALDWDDVDVREHVDDGRLAAALDWSDIDIYEFIDANEHLAGPVERLHELEDDDGKAYVWLVETEEARAQVSQMLEGAYLETHGRSPNAEHFVVSDVEQLREMDPDSVRLIDPAREETQGYEVTH